MWILSRRFVPTSPSITKAAPNDNKQYIDAMLEEYKTLRTESLNSINNRVTILLSSFTSLTIITSATVVARLPNLIVGTVLAVAVPTLAKTLAMVWLAEYRRSQRAGGAIVTLEERINEAIGRVSLSWETGLRSRKAKISTPYLYTVTILLTIAYLSEILSLYYVYKGSSVLLAWSTIPGLNCVIMTAAFALALCIVEFCSFFLIRAEWRHAKSASL